MNKNIIITGGCGQDAKILAKNIKNMNVYLIINKNVSEKYANLNYYNIDLLNYKKLFKFIKKIDPYGIIHLASKNETTKNKKLKYTIHYKNNFLMTKNLLNVIVNLNCKIKFIFAGSSQMFGLKKDIANENTKFKGSCFYSNYKIDSYKLIKDYKKKFKINATTLVLFNHDSIYRNKNFLLPRIASHIKEKNFKELNEIYKENIIGDFSHAEDICVAIYKTLKLDKLPDKMILSSFKLTYINKLIVFGLNKCGINKRFKFQKDGYKKLLLGDNSFAKKILNWNLKKNSLIAFKEILKNT